MENEDSSGNYSSKEKRMNRRRKQRYHIMMRERWRKTLF